MFLDLLAGGGLVAVGWIAGYVTARTIRRRSPGQEDCMCRHAVSVHDQSGCREQIKRAVRWDKHGTEADWSYVACPCVRYVAPGVSYVPEIDGPPRREQAKPQS